MNALTGIDWAVIGLYFAVLICIIIWVFRQKRQKNSSEYFLAGRNVGWFVVGASIFASNIGSDHVVGLAGTGAASGLALAQFELHAWIILMLGWVFLPFYTRSKVFTMPEFLEKRFDSRSRWFLSLVSLIGYVLTKVSVSVYAGGVVIETLLGVDFWTGAVAMVILTGIYTVIGGMRAVVYTEALQTIVIIVAAVSMTFIGLEKVGGWEVLKAEAGPSYFDMWPSASDPNFPWTGLLFGGAIIGIWYWCTDQYIVQRTLAARNVTIGRRGTIFAGFLKILPVFIFMVPGIIAYVLAKQGKLQMDSHDQAFTALTSVLPVGFRGLAVGGLVAALMSSLASVFNSCSTLFTIDIYKKLHPDTEEKKLVKVGRIATTIVVILGILWIPVMKQISGVLYVYLQSVQSYIAPPITAVFLLGLFSKRVNAISAITTLLSGFSLGMIRLILELNKSSLTGWAYSFATINFLHFAVFLFIFCVIVGLAVAYLTKKPTAAQIEGLTFTTLTAEQKAADRNSYSTMDIVLSILVVIIAGAIMYHFS